VVFDLHKVAHRIFGRAGRPLPDGHDLPALVVRRTGSERISVTGVRPGFAFFGTATSNLPAEAPAVAVDTAHPANSYQSSRYLFECSDDIATIADWPTLADLEHRNYLRGYAFQCRDHIEMWLHTIGKACKVRPVFVRVSTTASEPLLLLPLCVEKRGSVRFLEFIDRGVCDYNAPIVYAASASIDRLGLAQIWAGICRLAAPFDIAVLRKCPEFVAGFENPFYGLCTESWPASGHYVELAGTSDNGALLPAHDIKDSARQKKRLAEMGEVRFCTAHSEAEIERVFDTFVRQKSRRYSETLGTPGFDVPGQVSYYRNLAGAMFGRGVQLYYLTVANSIVATAWGLMADRRFYYLMCAYEGGHWQAYSTGRLLLEEIASRCRQDGVAVLDLGIGDEPYKFRWRQTPLKLGGMVQPANATGWTYHFGVTGARAVKKRIPTGLKREIKQLVNQVRWRKRNGKLGDQAR
jgi:CelD/BcsL family acetyltransferase involved in cellulose biosynthesis